MPLQITGRHTHITERQRSYIEKKVERFRRHFGEIDEFVVTVAAEKREHVVEISLRAGNIHIMSKGSDADSHAAIDKAVDKLEAQVPKAKDKRSGNKKHFGRPLVRSADEEES